MLKTRKISRSKYGNRYPPVERRIVIKSQPVRFIDHVPSRKKAARLYYECHNIPLITNLEIGHLPIHPDIYIDMEKDENCITTVRRTSSKIQWPNGKPKSRYHKKCATIDSKRILKPKKIKRKTIPSDQTIVETVLNQEKFENECYCHYDDGDTKSRTEIRGMKPIIISDNSEEKVEKTGYENNKKVKEICKNIDYNPQSEFLNRLKKGMKKAFNCKCSTCMLEKLEKSLKYTNRRALIEGAYSDISERLTEKSSIKKETDPKKTTEKCNCMQSLCDCKVKVTKKIRNKNFFETHSTEDLKTNVPPHKCVHKFDLDARLVPKPVKEDSYGQSRCQVCNKTQKSLKINVATVTPQLKKKVLNKKIQMPSTCSTSMNSFDFLSEKTRTNLQKYIQQKCERDSKNFEANEDKISPRTDSSNYNSYLGKCLCGLSKTSYLQNCNCMSKKKILMSNKFPSNLSWDHSRLNSSCSKINNNNNNTILELDLQNLDTDIMNSNKFFEKCKKNNIRPNVSPYNSLALRYQRGVFN